MRKIISFFHVSLDGFVSGPNGEMDWININDVIFEHVEKRISKGDTALYGRATYELMESYWPTAADKPNASRHDIEHAKWYAKVKKVVLSKTLSAEGLPQVQVISKDLAAQINQLKNGIGEDILVFGSPQATHSLMAEGLIDGYWLFVNPVILGEGVPLFANVQGKTKLKLVAPPHHFDNGVTELRYITNEQQ